ncbi:MAG: aminotransferase class IV [Ardenticatenaceae bacterium]|nr:aminotransferase class IV [Ardenticatenaceae bacterium]
MTIQWYAIEEKGVRPLPIPNGVSTFDGLYDGLALGVYSALRTFDHNKFLHLQDHIDRTAHSMRLLGWDYVLDEQRLRRALHEVCSTFPFSEARVRFDVLAAPPTHLGTNSREMIALLPFTPPDPALYARGVVVDFAPDLHRARPLAKTADFAQARRVYPVGGDVYEYILVDEAGYLLEGTGTNFYGVQDGVLRTAGSGVLAGITRRIVLELAAELGIPVDLTAVHITEIPLLQEAAVSGSSRAIVPVVQIGGQVVGNGRPGPICQRLLTAYNLFVSQEIKTAIEG